MDLVVPVYNVAPALPPIDGVTIRRALAYEKHFVLDFMQREFRQKWVSEVAVAMSTQPIRCFIAERAGKIIGFGCYDTTFRGVFGPTGVVRGERGKGIGKALLLACLQGMKNAGYVYAVIGGVGEARGFYETAVGAQLITGSDPGPYLYSLE